MRVGLVHLVRAANGVDALRRFCDAYRVTIGQRAHELIFLCKGDGAVEQAAEVATDLTPRIHVVPDVGFDLGSYARLVPTLDHEILCFAHSWSRPQVSGWLDVLIDPLEDPRVGIVGATGSFEAVPSYTTFPNPHIRTNAFALRRELFLELALPEPTNKYEAVLLEAGLNGITHQILSRGLRALVVGQDRTPRDVIDARSARVYRSGGQRNLLVADNMTDLYERSDPTFRAYMETLAWGSPEQA